jgi:hypothetical protein
VFEGIAKPSYSGASSWTWKGCPVPYVSFDGASTHTVKNLLKNREFGFREQYLDVLSRNKKEENTIKVENINGSILLLSAKEDAQWPSAEMGEMICERLKEKRFEYPYHHEVYHPASHFLCPVRTPARLVYRQERLFPKECERARQDALRLSVEWIKRV